MLDALCNRYAIVKYWLAAPMMQHPAAKPNTKCSSQNTQNLHPKIAQKNSDNLSSATERLVGVYDHHADHLIPKVRQYNATWSRMCCCQHRNRGAAFGGHAPRSFQRCPSSTIQLRIGARKLCFQSREHSMILALKCGLSALPVQMSK